MDALPDPVSGRRVAEPRALTLGEMLGDVVGVTGRARIEIEYDDDGRVARIWTHEQTRREQLGRFDQTPG